MGDPLVTNLVNAQLATGLSAGFSNENQNAPALLNSSPSQPASLVSSPDFRALLASPNLANGVFDAKLSLTVAQQRGLVLTGLPFQAGTLPIHLPLPQSTMNERGIVISPELLAALAQLTHLPMERVIVLAQLMQQSGSDLTWARVLIPSEQSVVNFLTLLRVLPSVEDRTLVQQLARDVSTPHEMDRLVQMVLEKFLPLSPTERQEVRRQLSNATAQTTQDLIATFALVADHVATATPQETVHTQTSQAGQPPATTHEPHPQDTRSSSTSTASAQTKGQQSSGENPAANTSFVTGAQPASSGTAAQQTAPQRPTLSVVKADATPAAMTSAPTTSISANEAEAQLRETLGPVLHNFVAHLSPKQAVMIRPLILRVAEERATTRDMEALATRLLPLLDISEGTTGQQSILRSWNHPSWQVRLLVVRLLKQVSMTPSALVRNGHPMLAAASKSEHNIPAELIYLARQPDSPAEVRSEAIRVALDMGGRQQKRREDMEALLQELEVVKTLEECLGSQEITLRLEGLRILARAWNWLEASVRERFVAYALKFARASRSEAVRLEALDLLISNVRDLNADTRRSLMGSDLYRRILVATQQKQQRGWTRFTDGRESLVQPAMRTYGQRPLPFARRAA